MVMEASGGPRMFHSRVVGEAGGVASGEGVSVGVDGGARVLVGRGDVVAVGSTGVGSNEHAHEKMTREAMKLNRRAIRGDNGKLGRVDMLKSQRLSCGTSIVRPNMRL